MHSIFGGTVCVVMVIAVVSCLLFRRLFAVKAKGHTNDIETFGVGNNADDIDVINLVGINGRITSNTNVSTKTIVKKVSSKRKQKQKTKDNPNYQSNQQNIENCSHITIKHFSRDTIENSTCNSHVPRRKKRKVKQGHIRRYRSEVSDELWAPSTQNHEFDMAIANDEKENVLLSRTRPSTAFNKVVEKVLAKSDMDDNSLPICDNQNMDNHKLIEIKNPDLDTYGHSNHDARQRKTIGENDHPCRFANVVSDELSLPNIRKHTFVMNTMSSRTRPSTALNRGVKEVLRESKQNEDSNESCHKQNYNLIEVKYSNYNTYEHSSYVTRETKSNGEGNVFGFPREMKDSLPSSRMQKPELDLMNTKEKKRSEPLSRTRPSTALNKGVEKVLPQSDVDDNSFSICDNQTLNNYNLIGIKYVNHTDTDTNGLLNCHARRIKSISKYEHRSRFLNNVCDELSLPHIRKHKLDANTPSSRTRPSTALNKVVEKVLAESEIDDNFNPLCNYQTLANYKLIGIKHPDLDTNDNVGYVDKRLHRKGTQDLFGHSRSDIHDNPTRPNMQKPKLNVINQSARIRPSTALKRVVAEVLRESKQDEGYHESCHQQNYNNYSLIEVKDTNPSTYDHSRYVPRGTKSKGEGNGFGFAHEIKDDLSASCMQKHELDVMTPIEKKRIAPLSGPRPSTALNKVVENVLAQSDVDDNSSPVCYNRNIDDYKYIGIKHVKHADPDTNGHLSRDARRIKSISKYEHRWRFLNETSDEPSLTHIRNHTLNVNTPSSRTRSSTILNEVVENKLAESEIDHNSRPLCNKENLANYKLSGINPDLDTRDDCSHVDRQVNRTKYDLFCRSLRKILDNPTRRHMQEHKRNVINSSSRSRLSTALNGVTKEVHVLGETKQEEDSSDICHKQNDNDYSLIEVNQTNPNTYARSTYVPRRKKSEGEENVCRSTNKIIRHLEC